MRAADEQGGGWRAARDTNKQTLYVSHAFIREQHNGEQPAL